jgi:hypothetical protein
MNRHRLTSLAALLLLAHLGCVPQSSSSMLVPSDPFGSQVPTQQTLAAQAPATQAAGSRVTGVGNRLVQANQHLALRPTFMTIGAPAPEIFHIGLNQVVITEGLVKQCENDCQLAAVLGTELGKMLSEREAQAGLGTRNAHREPPPSLGVGLEGGGSRGPSDLTHLAEQAPYEENRRRQMHPPPPPDPKALAKALLLKAGYTEEDLASAEPLLKAAAANTAWEKQMSASGGFTRPWTK